MKMRREGLEPSRPRGHGLLRPACLPVPPSARWSCSSLRAMHREGLEPSRPRGPGFLRPVCLPIPPPARWLVVSSKGMHREGLEPSRPRGHGHLKAARLPIPPPARIRQRIIGMTGLEPATSCSPSTRSHQTELHPVVRFRSLHVFDLLLGWQNSNLRPPARGTGPFRAPTPVAVLSRILGWSDLARDAGDVGCVPAVRPRRQNAKFPALSPRQSHNTICIRSRRPDQAGLHPEESTWEGSNLRHPRSERGALSD